MKRNFIDLFAGIGGFHLALHDENTQCVFASENDYYCRKTYLHNFHNISPDIFINEQFNNDIIKAVKKHSGKDAACS